MASSLDVYSPARARLEACAARPAGDESSANLLCGAGLTASKPWLTPRSLSRSMETDGCRCVGVSADHPPFQRRC